MLEGFIKKKGQLGYSYIDKHNMLLHLSIFYEYQQFVQHPICFSIQRPITVTHAPH
jgi:hypothetical protein